MDENAVEFLGKEWTEKEKEEIYGLIEKSEGKYFGNGYNFWRIRKFLNGEIVAMRFTWDMGGLNGNSHNDFIKKLKKYLNWE